MMREWLGVYPEIPIYRTDPGISYNIYRWCQNQLIYFLKRPLNNTTPSSQLITTMTSGISVTVSILVSGWLGLKSYYCKQQMLFRKPVCRLGLLY